jgi:hypothetical protein
MFLFSKRLLQENLTNYPQGTYKLVFFWPISQIWLTSRCFGQQGQNFNFCQLTNFVFSILKAMKSKNGGLDPFSTLIIISRGPNYPIKSIMKGLTINNYSILKTLGGELELSIQFYKLQKY